MESFFNGLQRFGIGRLTAILGAAGGAAAVLAAIILHVGAQPEALLYSNLDLKEASEITASLDQAGIKYDVKGDGSTIMVGRDKVDKARLLLASKGLPTAASVGYEIFDSAPALGQTEFVQNLNQQRAEEGELARTIGTLQGVASVRVHLVMPHRDLFEDQAEQPTASVMIGLSRGDLPAESVRTIRNVVAGAVPNLKPDSVTVADDRGHLLAAGGEDDDALDGAGAAHKTEVEANLRKQVMDIVESVVGPGAARVMVTADLDPTSTTSEKVQYDPDGTGPIVRSTQTSDSKDVNNAPDSGGLTTASSNIPNGTGQASTSSSALSQSGTTTELTNNEISTLKTTTVTTPGEIRKLSVAVVVDGIETPAKNGKGPETYVPRPAADMQKIQTLVAAGVGIDATRGDQLQVLNVRFSHDDTAAFGTAAKPPLFAFDKNDIMRAAEMGVLFIVALLTIFLVARPLLRFITSPPVTGFGGGALAGPAGLALAGAPGAAVGGPSLSYQAADNIAATGLVPSPEQEQRIDIARIEGQVKASSVKKVSEFVDRHPEESVSILRGWLHDN